VTGGQTWSEVPAKSTHQKHKCPGKNCYLLAAPVHAAKGARGR
jgi:hypothetical protein